jgi:tRNA(adenine34) deaminase
MTKLDDDRFMAMALEEAQSAQQRAEVPIGAVLVDADGVVLARAGNRTIGNRDPTAHAEMLCIREASQKLRNERLIGTTLYVTLEPCTMCAGAISFARIARLVYGAKDPKGGAIEHGAKFFASPTCHHRPEVTTGLRWGEAAALLKTFFQARR